MEISNKTDLMMSKINLSNEYLSQPTNLHGKNKLREVSQAFEGLFLQQILKSARAASLGDDLLGSSAVKSTQDMFDMELAKFSSSSSRLGIAGAIYQQFSHMVPDQRK